jgi:hypothetical protein
VACWGDRNREPAFVADLDDAAQLAAGDSELCARRSTGEVQCWTDHPSVSWSGRLWSAGRASRLFSGEHVCAQLDGGGFGCTQRRPDPEGHAVRVASVRRPFSGAPGLPSPDQIAVARRHAVQLVRWPCALRADSEVVCWENPGIAEADVDLDRHPPFGTIDPLTGAVEVAAGREHLCARFADGSVKCIYAGSGRRLGPDARTPLEVHGVVDAVELSAGWYHTCARRETGGVVCWGANYSGQLGDGTTRDRGQAVAVVGVHDAVELSAGGAHTCVRTRDDVVHCWGWGEHGQLGDHESTREPRHDPVEVQGITDAVALALADGRTCALRSDGTVACWGAAPTSWGDPAHCMPLPGGAFHCPEALGGGSGTNCGRTLDGRVESHARPREIIDLAPAIALTSNDHSIASLDAEGRLWRWTSLSNCDATGKLEVDPEPVQHPPGTIQVLADARCRLHREGTVACVPEGPTHDASRPSTEMERVAGVADVVQIAGGRRHTCALRRGGEVSCWGWNGTGQLGNGTLIDSPSPQAVQGVSDAVELAAGDWHTCARLRSGAVRCWGANHAGALGDGTTQARSIPVAAVGITATALAAEGWRTCALDPEDRVHCWGGRVRRDQIEESITVPRALTRLATVSPSRPHQRRSDHSSTAVAAATLSESTSGASGIVTASSASARSGADRPAPSLPTSSTSRCGAR